MFTFPLIFTIISFIPLSSTILDDDILYDIKWQPEITPPIELENDLIFTSKRKEIYSCVLPTPQTTFTTTAETILLTEAQPLLDKIHTTKMCVYRMDPYWTYELCHGAHIRQYHETKLAGKRVIDQEYFLGYYNADNQDIITNSDNQQVLKIYYKTINNQEIPMLSRRYTDGTKCDINSNRPRETVVFYVCNDKSNDLIISFQEVASCSYEMTVSSPHMCSVPQFSPSDANRHTINCYPKEYALQKPRNLRKLEYERQLLSKKGDGAQFTLTSADGTTFIISYEYVNEGESNDVTNNVNTDTPNKVTLPENDEELSDRDFLDDFFSGRECLTSGTGWWRYELCYGKHVVQFHDEGEQRTSILLGTWNRDKHVEWINTNPKKRSTGNVRERQYVPLYYSNGDICELTQTPRVVEVKLKCAKKTDKSQSLAMYLVEPEACAYILGVESPVFCNLIDYTDENGIPDQEKLIKSFDED